MMEWINILRARLRALFRRESVLRDIEEELRIHVEMETEANIERGMQAEAARDAAMKSFGNPGRNTELGYDVHGGGWLEAGWQDLRYGTRMLLKQPGFSLIAVLTLALGIGANTTIFSALEAVILHPFAFPNQDRLVVIYERMLGVGVNRANVTPGALHDWRAQSQSFERIVTANTDDFDLTGGDKPEQLRGYRVSAGFFAALGARPLLGRTFHPEEDRLGREQVVVLKHSLWERRFGSDAKILGQIIKLNNQSYTVIGVMPREFNFPYAGGEVWIPFVFLPAAAQDREHRYLRVIGLLKPGVSPAQGDAEIRQLSLRAQQQYPATNSGVDAFAVGLNEDYTRYTRLYLSFTLGAVMFVLLIACANVANLLLARGAARQKELAVRMALGAGRWRIVRQLLTESLLLALMGGALGLGLSVWGVAALANGIPQGFSQFIPGWERLGINVWALGFTMLASLVTGVLCGLLPAWQATKTGFNETLKEGGKGAMGGARHRWRNALVVAEVALSLVLLIGAGLLIRSFIKILDTDLGFNPDNAMAMEIRLPRDGYPQPEQRVNLYQELAQRVAALPGVAAVGLADGLPPGGWSIGPVQIVGRPPLPQSEQPRTGVMVTSPGYFAAIGTPLHAGRLFTAQDDAQAPPVALVNEAFARRYFADGSAIGQRLTFADGSPHEIVGIVANTMNDDLDDAAEPVVYQPFAQRANRTMALIVRGQTNQTGQENVTQLAGAIRRELAALDADVPISESKMLREHFRERSSPKRVITALLGVFALLALVMATVGLYAVMSFAVGQRTHEIGVRMALGAQPLDVLKMILRQGTVVTLTGVLAGLTASFVLTRVMKNLLFGVSATDPATFAAIAFFLAAVALGACYLPARRATKVNPLVALRSE